MLFDDNYIEDERKILKTLTLSSLPSGDSKDLDRTIDELNNPEDFSEYPGIRKELYNSDTDRSNKKLGGSNVKITQTMDEAVEMLKPRVGTIDFQGTDSYQTIQDTDKPPIDMTEILMSPEFVQKQRVQTTVKEIRQTGLGASWDQYISRVSDNEYLTLDEANSVAKGIGLDIKFETKGNRIKKREVLQRINNEYYKILRDSNAMRYQEEPDSSFLNKAQIFGAAVGTGMFGTPLDAVGTAALMFAPELMIGAVAKTAGAVNNATKANAVLNASAKITRAKTSKAMINAVYSSTDDIGLKVYAGHRIKRTLNTPSSAVSKVTPRVAKTLQNLSALKYSNLTALEKTGLDVATWTVGDIPIAAFKYYNDREIGSDLYTSRDAMSEILMAGSLGAVVPGAVRGIGKALGIYPKDVTIRRLNEASNEIKYKEAIGELSQKDASDALKAIDNIKKATEETANGVKQPHPSLAEAAEILPRINLDNDTVNTWWATIANEIAQGRGVPHISLLPQGKFAFSHIAFDVLTQFPQDGLTKTLGQFLLRNKSKHGFHSVKVNGETGAIGNYSAFGLSQKEAETFLENIYKGYALDDRNALEQAYAQYFRGQDFLDRLIAVRDEFRSKRAANAVKMTYSAEQLPNLKKILGDEYLKYRVGEKIAEKLIRFKDMPELPENIKASSEIKKLLQEARDFANRYVLEDKKNGKFVYDFKNEMGAKDDKFFDAFLDELSEGVNSNAKLVGLDEALAELDAARLTAYNEYRKQGLFVPDTDINQILGAPIRTYDDLKAMDDDAVAWQRELNIQEIRYEQKKLNEDLAKVQKHLDKFTIDEAKAFARFKPLQKIQEYITAEKNTKYYETKNNILKAFREDESIQKAVSKILTSPNKVDERSIKFIERKLKEVISSELASKAFSRLVNTSELTTKIVRSYMDKVKENADMLEALLNTTSLDELHLKQALDAENYRNTRPAEIEEEQAKLRKELKSRDQAGKKTEDGRAISQQLREKHRALEQEAIDIEDQEEALKAGTLSEINVEDNRLRDSEVFLAPLTSLLDAEFSRVQLQILNDFSIMLDKLYLMETHPHIAKEILIGGATQTIYNFKGANRSIENARKSAAVYKNAVLNELDKESSGSGGTLKEYALRESSKADIYDALIKLKHGEDLGTSNSDAERVAKILLKHEATLNSTMRVFGSNYTSPMDVIDPKKFKFFDADMPPERVEEMRARMNVREQLNPDSIKNKLFPDNVLRYNDQNYTDVAEINKMVDETIKDIQDTLDSFFSMEIPLHSKIALYLFRSQDLDKFLGGENELARISFNKVRDAILDNNWEDLLDGNYGNLVDAAKDLKTIRTILLGDKDGYRNHAKSTAWIVKYLTTSGTTAVKQKGINVPYLDIYKTRFYFKNAAEEAHAAALFGYDNVFDAFDANAQKIINARHVLDTFGSNPEMLCRDLVNAYERARVEDEAIFDSHLKIAKERTASGAHPIKSEELFGISESDMDSIIDSVNFACGMQNTAAAGWIRWLKAFQGLTTATMLMKAGLKSIADHGTILQGLLNNALAEGRLDAASTMGRAMKLMAEDKDIFRMVSAAAIIQEEDLLQKLTNNPFITAKEFSDSFTALDRFEGFARTVQDLAFNKLAQITNFTNYNKQIAGMSIQLAMGKKVGTKFTDLPRNMQLQLQREGFDAIDWEVLQKHGFSTLEDAHGEFKVFDPLSLSKISDTDIESILKAKGEMNISKSLIDKYRADIQGRAITLIDSAADEMVSLPSERTMSRMRLKLAKGSPGAFAVEALTQFQSFGASLVYNTYGRTIANSIAGECGVRVLDIFNPLVKMNWEVRKNAYNCLANALLNIGVAMTLVDSAVDIITGRIETPIKEDGTLNDDLLFKRTVAPLGIMGVYLDAIWEAGKGTGQGSGGIAFHVFPSGSRAIKTVSNVLKPLGSASVEDKAGAVAASAVKELVGLTGFSAHPFTALFWQSAFGSYLDMQIKGGPEDYKEILRGRERRGQVVLPWEQDPQLLWGVMGQ